MTKLQATTTDLTKTNFRLRMFFIIWLNQINSSWVDVHLRFSSGGRGKGTVRVEMLMPSPCGAWPGLLHGIRCGSDDGRPSSSGSDQFQWSSFSWPWRTSCLKKKKQVVWATRRSEVASCQLTWTGLSSWVSALRAQRLLDVVWWASATTANRVGLVAALSKAWRTLCL